MVSFNIKKPLCHVRHVYIFFNFWHLTFSQEKYYIQVSWNHIHTSKLQNFITYQSLQLFLVSCVSISSRWLISFFFFGNFPKSFLLFISSFSPIKKLTTFQQVYHMIDYSLSLSLSLDLLWVVCSSGGKIRFRAKSSLREWDLVLEISSRFFWGTSMFLLGNVLI